MQAAAVAQAMQATRKQRELFVGNLAQGLVAPVMIEALFNGALQPLLPPGSPSAVVTTRIDSSQKFAFVELATEELAIAALALDKITLCGRPLNIGRAKGYVPPPVPGAPLAFPPPLALLPTAPPPPASPCLLLENLMAASELLEASARLELVEDVKGECARFGELLQVTAPQPPAGLPAGAAGRVYLRFAEAGAAAACRANMAGRLFDGNRVIASPQSEEEMEAAMRGQWVER
jgi:splicing factor U2AF subunit